MAACETAKKTAEPPARCRLIGTGSPGTEQPTVWVKAERRLKVRNLSLDLDRYDTERHVHYLLIQGLTIACYPNHQDNGCE